MDYLKNAVEGAIGSIQSLIALQAEIQQASAMINETLVGGRKLLVCGNGGSAADASHFATEVACRFKEDRRPYPAICLTADGGLLTAIGNDYSFDELFARQVRAFGAAGDCLVVITSSGKSRNIVRALEEAKAAGLQSVAIMGRDGGFTKGLATVDIIIPGELTARIQEAQKVLIHVLCEMAEPVLGQP